MRKVRRLCPRQRPALNSPKSLLSERLFVASHFCGVEGLGELLGSDFKFVESFGTEFAHGATGGDAFFGNLTSGLVADDGGEAGDHGEGVLDEGLAALLIGDDALHAFFIEDGGDVSNESNGLQDGGNHDGHEDVEVEVSVRSRPSDGGLVAKDASRDHGDGFGHHGVDLAGHDGGTRLGGGERNLADRATWART